MTRCVLKQFKTAGQGRVFVVVMVASALFAWSLYANPRGGGGGHAGGSGGHVGGGGASGGHVGGGGGAHIGGSGGGHVGGVAGGGGHPAFSPGSIHSSGFSHSSPAFPSAGHIVTSPSSFSHGPNIAAGHASSPLHSSFGNVGHNFDATHWTGSHVSVPGHSIGVTASGGHSAWTPVATHTASAVHSTFGDTGHHFDAAQWTSGHLGDVHHFDPFHHDGHHAIFDHHDHHFGFIGLGLGFYGSSYPYYRYPYYDYYPYYPPSYYEVPVYDSTNSPYGTDVTPGNYQMAQAGNTGAATETRFPDVAIPRMELPSGEAPEALPDERTLQPPKK